MRWGSPCFPIVAMGLAALLMSGDMFREFGRTLMVVSTVCFFGVPFFYSILCVASHDKAARSVALLVPLGIWFLFSVLYIASSPNYRLHASVLALTVLGCLVINLLPFWVSIFSFHTQKMPADGHRELLYWAWPSIIPAMFVIYLALPLRGSAFGAKAVVTVLVYLLAFSFVLYALLFAIKKISHSSDE